MDYSSIEYSIPYVCILLVLFVCALLEQKNIKGFISKNFLRNFSLLLVIIFFGLRGYVASDWISYTQFYEDVPPIYNLFSSGYLKIVNFELGFVLFSSIIKTFSDNYIFYSFVNSLVNLLLLNIILKRYCGNYFIFGLAIYFAFCSEYEINMLRNVKAIMLFLISIKYILNRNIVAFLIINIIGLSFHNSAIFYFPLYFFIHKNNKKTYIILTIIGLIIYFFQVHYLSAITKIIGNALGGAFKGKNDIYLTSEESGITFGIFYSLIPLFLTFKYYDKIISYRKENIVFINLLFLYCFSTLYFSEVLVFRGRFAALFAFSLSVILPLYYILQKKVIDRKIISSLLLVIVVSKITITNMPILNKYDNIIFGISSYQERREIIDSYYYKYLR